MTIVMGLDQHRVQMTAEWIDTGTGEIARSRVAPALGRPSVDFWRGSAAGSSRWR
jgi:hypothetical protein